jgi:hypothetical protein
MFPPDPRRTDRPSVGGRNAYSMRRSRSYTRLYPARKIEGYDTLRRNWASNPRSLVDYPTYQSDQHRSRHPTRRVRFRNITRSNSRSQAPRQRRPSDPLTHYSDRHRSRSHGHRTTTRVRFHDNTRVDPRSREPRPPSPSSPSVYSDWEQFWVFDDEPWSSSADDWDTVSVESFSTPSVISVISETDGIELVRPIRRRGSAPELGYSPNGEEVRIYAERRQRPIERGRLKFFGYDDRPGRLIDDIREAEYPRSPRPLLDDSDVSTHFEPIPNAPYHYGSDVQRDVSTGKYPIYFPIVMLYFILQL